MRPYVFFFHLRLAAPKYPLCVIFSNPIKPNCLHITWPSFWSHSSSHIFPHFKSCRISTFPRKYHTRNTKFIDQKKNLICLTTTIATAAPIPEFFLFLIQYLYSQITSIRIFHSLHSLHLFTRFQNKTDVILCFNQNIYLFKIVYNISSIIYI